MDWNALKLWKSVDNEIFHDFKLTLSLESTDRFFREAKVTVRFCRCGDVVVSVIFCGCYFSGRKVNQKFTK